MTPDEFNKLSRSQRLAEVADELKAISASERVRQEARIAAGYQVGSSQDTERRIRALCAAAGLIDRLIVTGRDCQQRTPPRDLPAYIPALVNELTGHWHGAFAVKQEPSDADAT